MRGLEVFNEALEVETVFPGHGPILEGPRVLDGLRTLPWWAA